WHLDYRRVAVIGLAVGKGELQCFGHMVDVIRAVLPEAGEIGALEQCQSLQQDRPLAPSAASEDFEIAEPAALRRADRRAVLGEVLGREKTAFLSHEGDNLAGDVAAVERVARR